MLKVMTKTLVAALIVSLVLLPNFANATQDDTIPIGVRIQITNVNAATGQVDLDVIVSSYSAASAKDLIAVWIGDRFFYDWSNPTTSTKSNTEWVLVDPTGIKALDFGDGNVIDATMLAVDNVAPRTYRGSFSHTYAMAGNFTITTKVVGVYLGNTTAPNYGVNYGNPITFIPNQPDSPQVSANTRVTSKPQSDSYGFLAYRPTSGSSRIGARRGNMLGLSNTAQVTVNPQGGFGNGSIPIPFLDDFSKLLMGLFLAFAGGFVLVSRK